MNSTKTLGTWVWYRNSIYKPDEVIAFLTSKGVTEIYLAYHPQTSHENYRTFIQRASRDGVRVSLIGADAYWILDRGASDFDQFLRWFHEYQAGSGDEEQFYGLHFDIEPHQLAEWTADQEQTIERFKSLILKAEEACRKENVLLEVDIPFWFDIFKVAENNVTIPLCEFCIKHCDTTLLMSYRDNARDIFECGKFELSLSEKYKKKVSLAAETGKIYEEINITFYHMGTNALEREMQALDSLVSEESNPYEIGYAVHYYECWATLPEYGHPKGSDYPYSNPNYK